VTEREGLVEPGADERRPQLWLGRHGETEWSAGGRHTSRTDLDLTPAGEEQADLLAERLRGVRFDLVLTSPLRRARVTAVRAGFPDAEVEPAATEWAYGEYEGLTTSTIRESVPGWTIWHGAVPGGETADEVAARADRVVARVRERATERALLFAHGHFLRVLAARWLGMPASWGEHLKLGTGTLSVLGWERLAPAVEQWNVPP
jgi:probable phosphoglycerate mutase